MNIVMSEADTIARKYAEVTSTIDGQKASIAYCEMTKDRIKGVEYNAKTRDFVKSIAEELSKKYSDFRGYMLKNCKKSDLIKTIIEVCDRTIRIENERMEVSLASLKKLEEQESERKQRESYHALAARVAPYENEYIKSFGNVREGFRDWECLISCIESGHITEEELIKYGIDLTIPAQ